MSCAWPWATLLSAAPTPLSTSRTATTAATPNPRRGVTEAISSPIAVSTTAKIAAPASACRKPVSWSPTGSFASRAPPSSTTSGIAISRSTALAIAANRAVT